MNTFSEICEEYDKQCKAHGLDWKNNKIDYAGIESAIKKVAKKEYPEFSDSKIGYIWGKVYEDKHSYFGDCIFGMDDMCNFVKNMPK